MIRRLLHILARPSVLVLLFCLSFLLFNWPLLGAAEGGNVIQAHFSIFAIWTVVVAGLWVVTRAITFTERDDAPDHPEQRD